MNTNLAQELYKKLKEKYNYLFSTEELQNKSFNDIFYKIVQDAFIMYTHMAIRYQIISNVVQNIMKTPKIYNLHKNKYNSLLMCLDDIIDASNYISYKLYKITNLLKSNINK